jgi:Tol biopolymer transport system component
MVDPLEGCCRRGEPEQLSQNLARLPAVSPDGKWIASFYVEGHGDTQIEWPEIAVIPLSGGLPKARYKISTTINYLVGMQWVRGGSALAYVDDQTGSSNIWIQALSGGGSHPDDRL